MFNQAPTVVHAVQRAGSRWVGLDHTFGAPCIFGFHHSLAQRYADDWILRWRIDKGWKSYL